MKSMKKKHWRDLGFFALGTFLGGYVLGFIGSLLGGGAHKGR